MGKMTEPIDLDNVAVLVSDLNQEYDFQMSREGYIEEVESQGKLVTLPADDELFLDIDTEGQASTFKAAFYILRKYFSDMEIVDKRQSKNGGLHIYIKMPFEMDDVERIAWQAALGSDPIRELLSLIRCKNGIENPTLLVEEAK